MSGYEGALDALLYSQDEHERCDRALLRIADEQAAWRACVALGVLGAAFQRIADRRRVRSIVVCPETFGRRIEGWLLSDIDEALGLAEGPL